MLPSVFAYPGESLALAEDCVDLRHPPANRDLLRALLLAIPALDTRARARLLLREPGVLHASALQIAMNESVVVLLEVGRDVHAVWARRAIAALRAWYRHHHLVGLPDPLYECLVC